MEHDDDIPTYDVSNQKQSSHTPGMVDCWCSGSGCSHCRPCERCEGHGFLGTKQCFVCKGNGMRP